MKRFAFILSLLFAGCMQTENSSSLDDAYASGGTSDFLAVKSIMSVSCVPCHSFHTQTEAQLKAAGLVIPGDPANSKLYYRLSGATSGPGPRSMPSSGGALPSSQVDTFKTWIQNGGF